MITVSAEIDGGSYALSLRGHAGYNPGNDPVCAGVSSLLFALLGYLRNNSGHITEVRAMAYESGEADIDLDGDMTLRPAFEMAVIGLLQIAQKYPENIFLKNIIITEDF